LLKDSGRCFACGKDNPHGLKLDIRKTGDGVETVFVPDQRFAGWQGIVHGGIVATVLDELLAWACSARDLNSVTAEMTARFRKPMAVGSPYRGFGRVVEQRGRMVLTESRLMDESGAVVAEASGKMMRV
jgi:uncharacterized protein (TIGR00369 family)